MGLKAFALRLAAKWIRSRINKEQVNAIQIQQSILDHLLRKAEKTQFGIDHKFSRIKDYNAFKNQVPVATYEKNKQYFDRIVKEEMDVCWPGQPAYLAKTSGTTSGAKFIPITKDSIGYHISAARNALLCYVDETNDASFFEGKMIFLQGSPELTIHNGIKVGRLSGLVYHYVPQWLVKNRMPSYDVNCISNWEEKVKAISTETSKEDMTLMSGIPPWCIMYFEELLVASGKENIKALFPNMNLYVYGGLNYEPYRQKMEKLLGSEVSTIETYPASEGFFAFQDSQTTSGLLLNVNAGMFYEFVSVASYHSENPERISLAEVELNEQYVMVVSSNAGLWAYDTGDTVKFVSKTPYRLLVTGRIKHFISAFGEHVIAEEVEQALAAVMEQFKLKVTEFTVAPKVGGEGEASFHEWWIELDGESVTDNKGVAAAIDEVIQAKNIYYRDLRQGNILSCAEVVWVKQNGFHSMQEKQNKLGGQNKVQHLANNRDLVEQLARV